MFTIGHKESWDAYKYLQELAKWFLCWRLDVHETIHGMEEALMEENEGFFDQVGLLDIKENGNRL
jgi:hypothetical protein